MVRTLYSLDLQDDIIEEINEAKEFAKDIALSITDFFNIKDFHVIKTLANKGPMSLVEIQKALKFPRTTTFDILQRLLISGYIIKVEERKGGRGRPTVYYKAIIKIEI